MTPEQEVLADLLKAATAISGSARRTLDHIGELPGTDLEFEAMPPVQQIATTALLKQFEQLETTVHGLFRAILRTLGVRLKGLYPLDIANRMAELDVIDEPMRWVDVVKLRNELAHGYPIEAIDRYERFAGALRQLPFLFDASERAERVIRARALLDGEAR